MGRVARTKRIVGGGEGMEKEDSQAELTDSVFNGPYDPSSRLWVIDAERHLWEPTTAWIHSK